MYNIYYKNSKINNIQLSEDDINELLKQKNIKKYDKVRHVINEIPTNKLIIHKSIKIS